MMPQRVLHLLGTAQAENAAICRMVAALAAGIDRAQYEVHAWFLDGDGPFCAELRAAGIPVRLVDWPGGRADAGGAWRLFRALQFQQFALIHQHWGGRSVRWVARMASRAKLLAHFHGRIMERVSLEPVRIVASGADAVIAVSRAVSAQVAGAPPQVVYPGVRFPPEVARQAGRSRKAAMVIGTAGRLVPVKGIVYLVRAVASLRLEFPSLSLEIAGSGPERAVIEKEVRALGLDESVSFLGWLAEIPALLAEWDIFAMPSIDEGFGIAAVEAMAQGLPVVASNVGGIPEVVEDGRTGFLVPPRDIEGLAGRLRILLLDREKCLAMGAAGRERVHRYFTVERMIAEIAGMYAQLLQHPAGE